MIGQEGTLKQLEKYTVNKPPPTSAQIAKSTSYITNPIKETINNLKNKILDFKAKTTPIIFFGVIAFIVYLVSSKK